MELNSKYTARYQKVDSYNNFDPPIRTDDFLYKSETT